MLKKKIWLLNFSSSYSGGGLIRLLETAKWFDKTDGGNFIIHQMAFKYLKDYSNKNFYYVVTQSRIKRLFNDGFYIKKILDVIGTPDVYFSYGIPVFFSIGKVNWFHISNALSLITDKIDMPLLQRFKFILLKKRIIQSLIHVQIVSGESEFSLNLIKTASQKKYESVYCSILPNGFNEYEQQKAQHIVNDEEHYAITIGTFKYKKLSVALRLFRILQKKDTKLKTFIIVGNKDDLPSDVRKDENVIVDIGTNRESLMHLLCNSKYYISASQIENSSIATLEGLVFSKSVVLSDIPSHRELLKDLEFEELYVDEINELFLVANLESNTLFPNVLSWEQATSMFYEILKRYSEFDSKRISKYSKEL